MDPNATLAELRLLTTRVLDANSEEDFDDVTVDMAKGLVVLDEWLRAGGCIPKAWKAWAR